METIDLRNYLQPLFKWWWLLAAAAGIAAISSAIYTLQQPPVYRARTTVMVGSAIYDPNPNNSALQLTQQLAQNYANIAKRQGVRQATQEALGVNWLPEYHVWVVPQSPIIEFAVDASDPQFAQAVANELVNQLILQGPTQDAEQERQAFVAERLQKLETSIRETEDEIERLQNELASLLSAREIADTEAQIQALQNKLNTLDANYGTLLSTTQQGALNTLNVIEPAALPTRPRDSGLEKNVLLAALMGLMLAAGGAYLLEYIDDSIRSEEAITRLHDMAMLGKIPQWDVASQGDDVPLMLTDDQAPATEAYRMLRTNLQFAAVGKALNTILVTSPTEGDGKSMTAANLGAALAKIGKTVIIVDADLRRPKLHRLFSRINNVGVTTALLSDEWHFDVLLQETPVDGLRVLTSGPLPPNPAELLGSQRMRELLDTLQTQADIVILDSPPATLVSDTAMLSTLVDGVLIVFRHGHTRREAAKRALATLTQVNAHLAGAVLNGVPTQKPTESGYRYGYGYGYGYSLTQSVMKETPAIADTAGRHRRSEPSQAGSQRAGTPRRKVRKAFTLIPERKSADLSGPTNEVPENGYRESGTGPDKDA